MTANNNPRAIGGTIGGGSQNLRLAIRKLGQWLAEGHSTLERWAIRATLPAPDPVLEAVLTLRRAIRTAPTTRALRPIAKEANLLGREVRARRAQLRRAA